MNPLSTHPFKLPAPQFAGKASGRRLKYALATLLGLSGAVPFALAQNPQNDQFAPAPLGIEDRILTASDAPRIQNFLAQAKHQAKMRKGDLQQTEATWEKAVDPTTRLRLNKFFAAEEADVKAIEAGQITEEQRQVKVSLATFIPPGEVGNDGDIGPNFHVLKYWDEPQKDGTTLRIYVNEHWPVSPQDGSIMLPTEMRVRMQIAPADLKEAGSEKAFVPDMIKIAWGRNDDGLFGGRGVNVYFYRQFYYGRPDPKTGNSPRLHTTDVVSLPASCMRCHKPVKNDSFVTPYLQPGQARENFAAIVPDSEYSDQKPTREHRGVKEYNAFLDGLLAKADASPGPGYRYFKRDIQRLREDVLVTTNWRVPYILEDLTPKKMIDRLDGDKPKRSDEGISGVYAVKENGATVLYRMAAHAEQGDTTLLGIGKWWEPEALAVMPLPRNEKGHPYYPHTPDL